MKYMDKKVCVITGASGEIGKEIAKKFLDEYFLVLVDINKDKLIDLINTLNAKDNYALEVIDVSNEEEVKQLYSKYNRVDVLINAAGICGEYQETINYEFDNFKKIYEVNVYGTFLMMKYALPLMLENKGCVVNLGSVSGMRGYKYEIGYGSSKWAIIGMSKNVASEYANKGIRVNSISPGWVESKMMDKTLENYKQIGIENPSEYINLGPSNRSAKPEEIAELAYFLCSDQAKFINGSNIVIDGGMLTE